MARIKHYNPDTQQWEYSDISSAINNIRKVTGSGDITVTIADNTEYIYTNITSFTMTGSLVKACGFITFGGSTPTIAITGFTASDGDDITSAIASETWEFNCYNGYIIWKNWGV